MKEAKARACSGVLMLPGASSVECGRGIRVGAWIRVADGEAVIGEPPAGIMEGLVPGAQRVEEIASLTMEVSDTAESLSTHGLKTSGTWTSSARSGLNVG